MRRRKVSGAARLLAKSDADFGILLPCPHWRCLAPPARQRKYAPANYAPTSTNNPGKAEVERQRHLNGQEIFWQQIAFKRMR
jgi:hypothetical protein